MFMMTQAELLIRSQFGAEEKWSQINRAIWTYFHTHQGQRLGLSEIKQMAADAGVAVDDFLSLLSLLAGPSQKLIKCVYYRRADSGPGEEVSIGEVVRQIRRWWSEKAIDETEWRRWAAEVFVGWEPNEDIGKVRARLQDLRGPFR